MPCSWPSRSWAWPRSFGPRTSCWPWTSPSSARRTWTPAQWHDIAALADLPDGEISFLPAEGRHLFVYRKGDLLKVYDSRCPHQVTDIPHLALEGTRLTCPKHHWVFDVESGDCVEIGNRPLRLFEHKVEGGRVLAYW